jgi:hypothetical protein
LTRLPRVRALAFGAATLLGVVLLATVGAAAVPDNPELSNVAQPNLKAAGYAPAPKLSRELQQVVWAQGGTRLENPSGIVTDGTAPFNANSLAKAANATPSKRPENGLFRPGSDFKQFFFSETGDTNALSTENGAKLTGAGGAGGWGAIQKLTQSSPSANTGKLSLFFLCSGRPAGSAAERRHPCRRARCECRVRLRLCVRCQHQLLESEQQAGPLARAGPRCDGGDRQCLRWIRQERR